MRRAGGGGAAACLGGGCEQWRDAFRLGGEWVATSGRAQEWGGATEGPLALPLLLLDPGAELELRLSFAPPKPGLFTAQLLLRSGFHVCLCILSNEKLIFAIDVGRFT